MIKSGEIIILLMRLKSKLYFMNKHLTHLF